jgi:hypothetical protein
MTQQDHGTVRLTLELTAEAYSSLEALARDRNVPVETLGAELLAGSVVRCNDLEHGPALAGKVLPRAELDRRELSGLQMQRDAARIELDEVREEARHIAQRLTILADGRR